MRLTEQEQKILDGAQGEADRIALSILVELGELYDAEEMIAISQVHCDTSFYISEAGLEFVEHLAELNGRVAVPASLNTGLIDLERWQKYRVPVQLRETYVRLENAHLKMGLTPTWTCAPYQAGMIPRFGDQIAWTESNAIAFANSIIGARTNRYGDLMDICAAIAGKVPNFGLHLKENRRADLLIRLKDFNGTLFEDASMYPLLGYVVGELAGDKIPALEGIPRQIEVDILKGFSAAAASSGGVGLFHIIGMTPEAQDFEMCFQGQTPKEVYEISPTMIQQTREKLWTAEGNRVELIALGCPHFSYMEFRELAQRMEGKKIHPSVVVWVFTSRAVYGWVQNSGMLKQLEDAGIVVFTDGCPLMYPREQWDFKVVMTNSVKMANYCYAQTGLGLAYGSLKACVNAAVKGHLNGYS